jgi:glycosyltransferase involved in cell wall biosynthesis
LQHHCSFAGQVEHAEVLKKMSTAVATVVPSRQEAFGLVNIESMAVGTPVVASAVGGIPEIIRDGLDGFLVPPESPEALANRLKMILSDSHLRREMRANARHRFLSEFEQRRSIRRQADWFEDLAARQS